MQPDTITELPGDVGRIAEVVGIDAAIAIARHFAGNFLYISGLKILDRAARDDAIRQAYDAGVSVAALSRKHELTARRVRDILNSPTTAVKLRNPA